MPFYEYECASCKFYTEVLQKITDEPLRKCPSCGKHQLKKLVSAPVFRLKGSGWYETDFKSDKETKRNLAVDKEPESASTEKSGDGKSTESKSSESKPAAATPSRSARRVAARRASPAVASKAKRPAKAKAKASARRKRR
ncbi:MAG: zinc ribbon domain-containing protein [Steroidobacteraceae bacterium]|nr:zinc ribbon domain-containing protein [Steroidobacteraceae bacterium]